MVVKVGTMRVGMVVRLAMTVVLTVLVAGCDKCGNRLKFNAPSLPKACGDNADPSG